MADSIQFVFGLVSYFTSTALIFLPLLLLFFEIFYFFKLKLAFEQSISAHVILDISCADSGNIFIDFFISCLGTKMLDCNLNFRQIQIFSQWSRISSSCA